VGLLGSGRVLPPPSSPRAAVAGPLGAKPWARPGAAGARPYAGPGRRREVPAHKGLCEAALAPACARSGAEEPAASLAQAGCAGSAGAVLAGALRRARLRAPRPWPLSPLRGWDSRSGAASSGARRVGWTCAAPPPTLLLTGEPWVQPRLCRGRYAGTAMLRGRSRPGAGLAVLAITKALEPHEGCGAVTLGPQQTAMQTQHVARDGRASPAAPRKKMGNIRSEGRCVS